MTEAVKILCRLLNFDEVPVPYEPPSNRLGWGYAPRGSGPATAPGEGKSYKNYTLGPPHTTHLHPYMHTQFCPHVHTRVCS